jgi:aryl-alcohol dehydrogenase-like predicted oxidoreductase
VKYRRLGRTGLKVSRISLGNAQPRRKPLDEGTAAALVKAAFDAGVNFFDTADAYADGQAEQVLGRAIRGIPRPELVIGTKVQMPVFRGPNGGGLSRKHVLEGCEASLRRLGLDYVDLYQVHDFDPETPLDETLGAMDQLIRQGKVLYAGCSNFSAAHLCEAMLCACQRGTVRFDCIQPEYSMLRRKIEAEFLPFCGRHGIGVVVYSPLAQGVLTGKYPSVDAPPAGSRMSVGKSVFLTAENLAKVERLRPVAAEAGCTLGQLALAWVLAHPEVSSAITGASRLEQLAENLAAGEIDLSPELLARIEKALADVPGPAA